MSWVRVLVIGIVLAAVTATMLAVGGDSRTQPEAPTGPANVGVSRAAVEESAANATTVPTDDRSTPAVTPTTTTTTTATTTTTTVPPATTTTTVPPPTRCGERATDAADGPWNHIFADDFASDVPLGSFPTRAGNWDAYPSGWPDTVAGRFVDGDLNPNGGVYRPDDVVSVADGVLNKYLHHDPVSGEFRVAAILPIRRDSRDSFWFDQLYGRYSICARIPEPIPGYKLAWLLWPESGVWPRDGEIDFPEMDLGEGDTVSGFVHRQDATEGADQWRTRVKVERSEWNEYTIEWSPSRVVFELNGSVIGDFTERIPDTPMHWVIQTETVLDSDPPPVDSSGDVQIDWVSMWSYVAERNPDDPLGNIS